MPIAANTVALYLYENNLLDSGGKGYDLNDFGGVTYHTSPTPIPEGSYCIGGNFTDPTRAYIPYTASPTIGTFLGDFSNLVNYTIETYVYINGPMAGSDLLEIYDDNNVQYGLLLSITSAGAIAYHSNGASNSLTTSDGVVSANTWHHIAITNDSSNKKIYLDNVLVASGPTAGGTPSLSVGRELLLGGGLGSLDGYLDQTRFSNITRTGPFPTTDTTPTPPSMGVPDKDINKIPRNLSSIQLSENVLKLSWSAPINSTGISKYNIYKSYTDDLVFEPRASTTNLQFLDSGLEHNRTYFYTVTAVYSGLESDFNYAPKNLTAKLNATNPSSIILNWSVPSGVVSGYQIWRSNTYDGVFSRLDTTGGTSYIDTGITDITLPYYYRLTSFY